jgi:hypothetical protein
MLRAQARFVATHGIVELRAERSGAPGQDVPTAGSRHLGEQCFRFFQVRGVEAFGERAIEGREQVAGVVPPALLAPQLGEASGGAQFVAPCALLARDREGAAERVLGLCRIRIWQATGKFAAQSMNFRVPAPLAGDGRFCQCVVQGSKAKRER